MRHRRCRIRPHRRVDYRHPAGAVAAGARAGRRRACAERLLRARRSLTETKVKGAQVGRRAREPTERAAARRARATSISTPSGYDDAITWIAGRAEAHRPNDVNLSTDLGVVLLLHEPGGQGARCSSSRSLSDRSQTHEDAAERRHRQGVRQAGSRRRDQGAGSRSSISAGQPRRAGRQARARHACDRLTRRPAQRSREASWCSGLALFVILSTVHRRASWRLVDGVIEGLSGRLAGGEPRDSRRPDGPRSGVRHMRRARSLRRHRRRTAARCSSAPTTAAISIRATGRMSIESLRADIVESRPAHVRRAATPPANDGNISVRARRRSPADDARRASAKGFMTPDMMCVTDLDGQASSRATAIRRPRC